MSSPLTLKVVDPTPEEAEKSNEIIEKVNGTRCTECLWWEKVDDYIGLCRYFVDMNKEKNDNL